MRFSADCKDFYNALNFIQRGVATRTTMPILLNILVEPHQPILALDLDNKNWSVIQVPIASKEDTKKWEREKQELDKPKGDDF